MSKPPRYYVVEFVGRGRKPSIKKLDIVVASWVYTAKNTNKVVVKFPEPPYEYLHDYLQKELPADSNWSNFTVRIRARAETIVEAENKLKSLNDKESAFTLSSGEDSSEAERCEIKAIKKRKFIESTNQYKETICTKVKDDHSGSSNSIMSIASKLDDMSRESLYTNNSPRNSIKPRRILNDITTRNVKQLDSPQHKQIYSESFQGVIIDYLNNISNSIVELTGEVKANSDEIRSLRSLALQNSQVSSENYIGDCKELGLKYNYAIPFNTIEEFQDFDLALQKNDSLMKDLKSTLLSGIDGSLVISKCIVNMLKMFLSKEVAMKFTATKKIKSKLVMKITNLYMCIERVIKERRKLANLTITEKEFKTALSNVLTNAVSWGGSNKKSKTENTDDILEKNSFPQITEGTLLDYEDDEVSEESLVPYC